MWLAILLGFAALVSWAGPSVHAAGGPVLLALLALVALTGFWWFTMWLLLAGRVSWRELFPSALATAICWLAMSVVFNLTMSSTITSNYKKYGDIGVVLVAHVVPDRDRGRHHPRRHHRRRLATAKDHRAG